MLFLFFPGQPMAIALIRSGMPRNFISAIYDGRAKQEEVAIWNYFGTDRASCLSPILPRTNFRMYVGVVTFQFSKHPGSYLRIDQRSFE